MHPEMIRNAIYDEKNVFFCKICAKSFKTESYLAVHLLSHSTNDPNGKCFNYFVGSTKMGKETSQKSKFSHEKYGLFTFLGNSV